MITSRFLLGIATLILYPLYAVTAHGDLKESETLEKETVEIAVDRSASYLINAVLPTGKFEYLVNPDNHSTSHKYNVLRHAGTIYALASYYEKSPSEDLHLTLSNASKFLIDCCIAGVPEDKNLLAVWSFPRLTNTNKELKAKLGGAGLSLLALSLLKDLEINTIAIEDLRKIANFVLFMQKNNGSFYSRYIPSQGGRDDTWTSLYYPGEAALGLLKLHNIDPNPKWIEGAVKALSYLADSREHENNLPADHWALIATNELAHQYPWYLDSLPEMKEKLLTHARKIVKSILLEQNLLGDFMGSFGIDGRTAPTATRLEGLLAARHALTPTDILELRLEEHITLGIQFLLSAQIKSGKYAGGVPKALSLNPDKQNSIRIDYVQHTISAFLEYIDLVSDSET